MEQEIPQSKKFNLPAIENLATSLAGPPIEIPPEIIEGVLHQGSKAVLGSNSKARKTWILLDLALSVASGSP
jgi:RecA-family ATPase